MPAAVMIAAAEVAQGNGYSLAAAIENNLKEIPKVVEYFWVTVQMSISRRVTSPAERLAFTESILGAYNSRFKKPSKVDWAGDGQAAVVSMAAGGYSIPEVEDSVKEMIKRHAAKGASIAPEHQVEVKVLRTSPL